MSHAHVPTISTADHYAAYVRHTPTREVPMLKPERHLSLAAAPVNVIVANGAAHVNRGGQSIEIPAADIDRIVAAPIVAADEIGGVS